jgi:hypothetical protein
MRLRSKIVTALIAATALGSGTAVLTSGSTPAQASGSTVKAVSETNTMTSALCYREVEREVVYYTHSSTKGWVREPAPKVTIVISTHCYAK